jgi:hypothetical protein
VGDLARWRRRGFTAGWLLFAADGVGLFVAGVREHHWVYAKLFHEGSIWTWGGMLASMASILFLLCGKGWWRGLLEVAAFIELYCWFSWLMFAVQMR